MVTIAYYPVSGGRWCVANYRNGTRISSKVYLASEEASRIYAESEARNLGNGYRVVKVSDETQVYQ